MDERERQLQALLAYAREDADVIGLFVFGSRGRDDGLPDARSDYDVAVVLRDGDGVLETFDQRWPYVHGAPVEVARSTLSGLRQHGDYGTPSAWARYQYVRVKLLVDKTGEVEAVLREKRRVPDEVRDRLVRDELDNYINSTYRSLRYGMVGSEEGARLDAAESLPYLLTAVFALDGRVRPFNKYLGAELRQEPLTDGAWEAERFLGRLTAVLAGDVEEQHALFRDVDRVARQRGFGDAIDEWEPDVAWLRGEAEYRAGSTIGACASG